MKYYQIVVFVFLFNLSIAMLNISDAFPSVYERNYDENLINSTRQTVTNSSGETTQVSQEGDLSLSAIGNFALGLSLFVGLFFQSLVFVGPTISSMLGGSVEAQTLGFYIGSIVYLIYAGALVQFIAGRSFKGSD